jgi:rhodanese-related sulfurtransferase
VTPRAAAGTIVDVRQAEEFAHAHVPGAVNVELGSLARASLPRVPITVMCGHGERAMSGASLLTTRGYEVSVLDGGPGTWSAELGRALATS